MTAGTAGVISYGRKSRFIAALKVDVKSFEMYLDKCGSFVSVK